jgi:AraC-like DNA-binding protein
MEYNEIKPDLRLKKYVKCFYSYESETDDSFEDTVFPNGTMEIIFNLGKGKWQTGTGNGFVTTPPVEFWGQIIKPLSIKSIGRNTMLGIRFFPHAASCFLNDKIELFNDQIVDFSELSGNTVEILHSKLLETTIWNKRIELVEGYLLYKLSFSQRRFSKMAIVGDIINEMSQYDFFDNIENVATRYGMTSRYLQKLFLNYTGLTPKLYNKIHRFQNSLRLVIKKDTSLTSIAYDCGYFDQSHFIKEFKTFTGFTPSGYSNKNSPAALVPPGN